MRTLAKTWKVLLLIPLLWGCGNKPEMSMQALSSSLMQMKSSGVGPFDQDFGNNKYLVFQGQCISIITDFQLQINNSPWFNIPANPDNAVGAEINAGTTYTYDINCSNGTYTFWVYEHQFEAWAATAGIDIHADGAVSSISIRGLAGGFATEPTIYNNNNAGGNDAATQILITKEIAPYGAAIDQCVEISVQLRSATGSQTSTSTVIPFSLTSNMDLSASVFDGFQNCYAGSPQLNSNSLSILSGKSERKVVFKVPGYLNVGDTVTFTLGYSGSLTVSQGSLSFAIRDANVDKYLAYKGPNKILPEFCYPAQVSLHHYNNNVVSGLSTSVTGSTTSELHFFSDPTCSMNLSNSFIIGSSGVKYFYIKATSVGATTSGNLQFSASSIDSGNATLFYDKSGDTSVHHIRLTGPPTASTGNSALYTLGFYNSHSTPVPQAGAAQIDVSVPNGSGTVCTPSCLSYSGTVHFSAGQSEQEFYFTPSAAGTVQISADDSAGHTHSQTVTVSP